MLPLRGQLGRLSMHKSFERPRISLQVSGICARTELLRWLLEQRRITYVEEIYPSLEAGGRPKLTTADRAAQGMIAAVNLIDSRSRKTEKVYGATDSGEVFDAELLKTLWFKLGRAGLLLWMHFVSSAPRRSFSKLPAVESKLWSEARQSTKFAIRLLELEERRATEFNLDELKSAIESALDMADAILDRQGSSFLAGEVPGVPDVIFSAMASPLLLPEGCSTPFPLLETMPDELRQLIDQCRSRPCGKVGMETYRLIRPKRQEAMRDIREKTGFVGWLLRPPILRFGAKTLVRWAPRLQIGSRYIVSDWAGCAEVLDRDNDFLIGPINQKRIESVSGPFILGMDRSKELLEQRRHVYSALRSADRSALAPLAKSEADRLIDEAIAEQGRIDVVNGYARLIGARLASKLFGILGPTEQDLMRVARAIFHETFLNLSDDPEVRVRGIAAGKELRAWIEQEIRTRRAGDVSNNDNDVLGCLMRSTGADEDASRAMLAGLLVGAIDTTATAVANIAKVILDDPVLKQTMRGDLDDPLRLSGWCWEALRRRPHNPLLIRRAGPHAQLAGRPIKKDALVIVLTVGAMHDPMAFASPEMLRPDRPPDRYMHFGRGLHLCSGRDFNAVHIPTLVGGLLRRGLKSGSRIRMCGPFPDEFVVEFKKMN